MPVADRSSLDLVFLKAHPGYLNWFCEFTAPDVGLGGYFRYGVLPDEDIATVIVQLAGPKWPLVSLVDLSASIDGAPTAVRTDRFGFEHGTREPGLSYHVAVEGIGEAYATSEGPLRGEIPTSVDVSLELTWATGGTPFAYPIAPGYEIPCWVSGQVMIDGETKLVSRAPAQRNHTTGKRDWWAMEWVWTELRLDDESHLIATDVDVPEIGQVSMGCIQSPSGALVELESVRAVVAVGEDLLPRTTHVIVEPRSLVVPILESDIKGRVSLPLIAEDGRVAHFMRAWVTPTLSDGRKAAGWVEWHKHVRGL